jgi:hypothetical protein
MLERQDVASQCAVRSLPYLVLVMCLYTNRADQGGGLPSKSSQEARDLISVIDWGQSPGPNTEERDERKTRAFKNNYPKFQSLSLV